MPVAPDWPEVAVRLALTLLAGAIFGFERGEQGRPAGLRTTMLVGLAASIAMIQAELMAAEVNGTAAPTVSMDYMRLPLGVLTGVGFIGAGTILKRGELVLGVTTASTLWFVTIIGLCFGAGQLILGLVGLVLGIAVLSGLRRLEKNMPVLRQGTLGLRLQEVGFAARRWDELLEQAGLQIHSRSLERDKAQQSTKLTFDVSWRDVDREQSMPPAIDILASNPEVSELKWTPRDTKRV